MGELLLFISLLFLRHA